MLVMKQPSGAMHVATIRRRHGDRVYESHLIRRSVREGGHVRHETIANVSKLPPAALEALRLALAGETLTSAEESFEVVRSLPAGHVAALLAACRRLGLARLLDRAPSRARTLVVAMIVQRLLAPGSKLACARALARSTLAEELELGSVDEDELYDALDWLLMRQERIEARLAARHLPAGSLALYDLTSSYVEGSHCPLASYGYSRDARRDRVQITYGLLTSEGGVPVAVSVYAGAVHDSQTLTDQLEKLSERFACSELVLACDRGMVSAAGLEAIRERPGIDFVSALRAPAIKRLARAGAFQPSLFDELALAEIVSEEFPGERLVVCRNPLVAAERARKREALLAATEADLSRLAERVRAGRLSGAAEIGLAVGEVARRHRMKKHLTLEIGEESFAFARRAERIAEEAALDGIYILRTSASAERLPAAGVVRAYKQLKEVERDFRVLKGPQLCVRPIYHYREGRVRAHVFLCMLALYVEHHLRCAWRELTYADECPPLRADPVAKATRSPAAAAKAASRRNSDGLAVMSFVEILAELATQSRSTIRLAGGATFAKLATPSPLQARALELVETIAAP